MRAFGIFGPSVGLTQGPQPTYQCVIDSIDLATRVEYPAVPLSSVDLAALRAAEQALVESFEASDPTAWVDFYTDDAIFVAPGSPAIEGREAL